MNSISHEQQEFFVGKGYLVIENLIGKKDVKYYDNLYNSFLNNEIDASRYRSDLSGGNYEKEKITQIMVPSKLKREQRVDHTEKCKVRK